MGSLVSMWTLIASYGTHPVEPKRRETPVRKWLVMGIEIVCLFPMGALLAPLMAFGLLSFSE